MGSPARVVFIDALRLLATFQMVQGHTIDAVLATEVRSGWLFDLWQSARGLTAVSFLFVAGLAFQQTTLSRLSAYRADPVRSQRRLLRAVRLIALGYLLHLPVALLWTEQPDARALILRDFLGVDVLQCIGVTLLLFDGLVRALSSARWIALAATALGAVAFVGAPLTQALVVDGPWFPLLSYVSPQGGSIFPLLPWAGHFALGVGIAHWAQGAWLPRLFAIGIGVGVVGLGLTLIPGVEVLATHVLRLSAVSLICALLAVLLKKRQRLAAWMERLAGATLTVYVFHILLVYGAGIGLSAWIGPRLSLPAALLVTALVVALSTLVALGFGAGRARRALAAPTRKR